MEISEEAKEQIIKLARIRFYYNENVFYSDGMTNRKKIYVIRQQEQTMAVIENLLRELGIDWRNYSGLRSRYGEFVLGN